MLAEDRIAFDLRTLFGFRALAAKSPLRFNIHQIAVLTALTFDRAIAREGHIHPGHADGGLRLYCDDAPDRQA